MYLTYHYLKRFEKVWLCCLHLHFDKERGVSSNSDLEISFSLMSSGNDGEGILLPATALSEYSVNERVSA